MGHCSVTSITREAIEKPMNQKPFKNWAGQYECTPARVHYPSSTDDIQRLVGDAAQRGSRIRVFGSGHSPSDIAMSDEDLVIVNRLDRVLSVDCRDRVAVTQAGVTLAQLNQVLAENGMALPNLGSISKQTIAGAMATATHGTGLGYGVLPTIIQEMTIVTASGEMLRTSASENPKIFSAARCNLGAIGLVTELKLKVCDAFDLEVTEQPNDLETVLEKLPDLLKSDHYRFWYLPHAERVWEWTATRQPPEKRSPKLNVLQRIQAWYRNRLIGYRGFEFLLYLATYQTRLIPHINRWYAREMFSRPKSSRGDSVSQFNFDCLFKQHVNEWCVPIAGTAEAILRIRQMILDRDYQVHLPIEVRFVRGDDIWLSPCFGSDRCYIGVIAYMPYEKSVDYQAYFADFEKIMTDLGGRPHWAKRFGPDASVLKNMYPHWQDFQAVRSQIDPEDRFGNSYTDRVLGNPKKSASVN